MKLKKMEILGFKSFLDKAGIEFPEGVCAIVGPNGCGKSNIFDALRWVMGEQSVKQLRGKAMEDIIFAGAGGKPPLNMAEVSLTLSNDGSFMPEELRDFSEIMITRRLYRSGESTYLINKRPCRLKDIHNVFLGSGLGAKSYAIIQQGRIGAITDAGPEERRVFIEEAAGVTRYKQRKDEALRKLTATQQNLLRLNDIIVEVERQMNGLKRQAKKAEQYNQFQEQTVQLDVRLTLHHYEALSREIQEADALLTRLRDADTAHFAELKKLDAVLEAIKLSRWRKNQLISEQKSNQFEYQRRVDKAENDLAHLREEIGRLGSEQAGLQAAHNELAEKNQTIDGEIDQVRTENNQTRSALESVKVTLNREHEASRAIREKLSALNAVMEDKKRRLLDLSAREAQYQNIFQHSENTKETLKRRLRLADEQEVLARKKVSEVQQRVQTAHEDLDECCRELADLKGRVSTSEKEVHESGRALSEQIKQHQRLQLERKSCVSQYATLKKMEESMGWYKDGVKAILTSCGVKKGDDERDVVPAPVNGVLGIVADMVEPAPSYEMAVEAVFGESLQYILVSDHEAGMGAIDYLQRSGAGRGGFVPVSAVKTVTNGSSKGPDADKRLLNHVTIQPGYENVAEALLGHVAVAEDLSEAMALYHRNGAVQSVVTKGGDVVSHQGIMIGGSRENLAGILLKKKELKALQHQIFEMDSALDEVGRIRTELEVRVRAAETGLQQLIEKKNRAVRNELEFEKAHYKAGEDLKTAQHHLDIVQLEQEQLQGEQNDVDEELNRFRGELVQIRKEIQATQQEINELAAEFGNLTRQIESFDRRIVDGKMTQTSLNARLENGEKTLKRLADFQRDGQERLEQLRLDIDAKAGRQIAAKERAAELDASLAAMYEQLTSLNCALEENESQYQAISADMQHKDTAVSDIQTQREKTLQNIRMLETEQAQRGTRLESLAVRMEERYQRPFEELKSRFADVEDERSPEQIETQLVELRQRITNMGEVNPGAIREYDTQKERFEFLTTQRDDLNRALEDLQKVIRKISRVTQARFLETLSRVNEKLKEVFPRLFEGGSAELVLTDLNNPLESGLEFIIHPPGKKVTRLSLLSGGEKAMSAIAFIFSIFLIKPASFCLLDEIDAPLDESNVFRFNELLRIIGEQSQIVIVTHNKRSMEFADTLFGVTMEKKGISKVVSVSLERREAA
ncbi:MAG: chromosome segregation protein SMC [Desulfobacterales bacterium]|jgi:chromosome segregation protein|nr:chromosome segregation protein SMC [Desulfobacterales bacterium]